MRKHFFALSFLLSLISASTAFAADIWTDSEAPELKGSYDWSGAYAGMNIGYGFSQATTASANVIDFDLRGGLVGLHAGMNWQMDSLVLGLEGKVAHGGIMTSAPCKNPVFTCYGNIDAIASASARVGFAQDNYLIYGKAGLAYAHVKTDVDPTYPGYEFGTLGYLVGAGIEVGLSEQISASLEYSYMAFQQATAPVGALETNEVNINAQVHLVELGMNYRF